MSDTIDPTPRLHPRQPFSFFNLLPLKSCESRDLFMKAMAESLVNDPEFNPYDNIMDGFNVALMKRPSPRHQPARSNITRSIAIEMCEAVRILGTGKD